MKRSEKQINEPEVQKQLEYYSRFLPAELFSAEGHREMEACVLDLNLAGFEEIVRHKQTSGIYALINEIASLCVPVIYEKGGIVYEFREGGFGALFLSKPLEAMKAAVHLCELLRQKEGGFAYWDSFSIGAAFGNVMAGIVGCRERMSPLTLSVYTGLSRRLQEMGSRYGAKILVTGTLAKLVPEFPLRFNQRLLGYLYIKNGAFVEMVYDVFDGDEGKTRNCKRKTKTVFEKGVRLFSEGDYQGSRYYFIEVLKTDQGDKAAKAYVQLCEKRMSSGKQEKVIYLEIY